ncbi:MAG: hypothetical protein ABI651_14095 [Verrucomicrobiota bacterium]
MQRRVIYWLSFWATLVLAVLPAWAIDDIGPTNRVWLQGVVELVTSGGFKNEGLLLLETIDDAYNINLLIATGAVTNTTTGLVQINPGAGGNRGISANWFNDGTINVNYRAVLSRTNGFFYQRGNFNIASNSIVYVYSTNGVFNQDSGKFEIEGEVEFKWVTFNYNGGTIGGSPTLINSSLLIGQTATNPAAFVFNGPECQLLGNNPTNCILEVQGSDLEGAVVLNHAGGFRNDGTLFLDSTNTPADATLIVGHGGIANSSSGIINIEYGAGGQREIDADLINLGRISVNNVLTINSPSGGITNAGKLKISADQLLMVKSNYVQAPSGSLEIELVASEPGFEHEALNVAGPARIDGLLEITLPAGFTPPLNVTFVLLRCEKRVGFFKDVVVPSLPNQQTWKIDYHDQDVTLTVRQTVEIPSLKEFRLLSGDNFYLVFSGTVGGGYILQRSADLIQWSNVRTNQPFSGVLEYVESNIKQIAHRFYRVITAP